MNKRLTIIYSILFICSILIVFKIIPYLLGTIIVTASLLFLDKKAIKEVNYPLLATFCVFFIFSGNMARIPAVSSFFSKILPVNVLLFSTLSCQFISNVPSAVLLSHFTNDYSSLLPAVNIGGLGTLIASLASLITLKFYMSAKESNILKFLGLFTIANVIGLVILTGYTML